jgi:hypothetical protein
LCVDFRFCDFAISVVAVSLIKFPNPQSQNQ